MRAYATHIRLISVYLVQSLYIFLFSYCWLSFLPEPKLYLYLRTYFIQLSLTKICEEKGPRMRKNLRERFTGDMFLCERVV